MNTKKQLNDDQIAKDILTDLKNLAKLYMNAILESSCTQMRSTLGSIHMDITQKQYECFDYLNKNNLYPIEYAEPKKVKEAIGKFTPL